MRKSLGFSGLVLAVSLAACVGAEGALASDGMRATGLEVAGDPRVDMRYPAVLTYEASADVRVIETCFTWWDADPETSWLDRKLWFGNGPYCLGPESDAEPGAVKTMLVTGYPGIYHLEGYIRYMDGGVSRRSNRVSTEITVAPRY